MADIIIPLNRGESTMWVDTYHGMSEADGEPFNNVTILVHNGDAVSFHMTDRQAAEFVRVVTRALESHRSQYLS